MVFVIVNELIILAMTLARINKSSDKSFSGLLDNLVHGGLFYCACMTVFSIANLLTWCIQGSYPGILNVYQTTFHAIMASRFQLHTFNASRTSHTQCDSTVASLRFAENMNQSSQREINELLV
ncbi:hypothetical protein CONPUDRAFT_146389 [Coniophora puteana RWD-64-598 SS2]|uniref:Uncharacterized protein n=1 Tax=Coniophora puteana (strain RWD-64-598) TaxID=741705 RepID=A0A5M3MFS9_CONPW|nr:uncharacterized protein CONPUDRAFT_146389 [Coniophora puteana RWD-64-598 SS2]EIW77451.1 hypothetical protein CONPUDRAFT_146389 [Coniophora puteana RWD-64-598 SS2]